MKLNENTIIKGNLVILVPYEKYHVPKYHEWMKSEELQILTASEPLSLEEEYNMQKCWRNDPDKCTFIVLNKVSYDQLEDEVNAMVGDTNIFLKNMDATIVGEIEIMVAESSIRNKGLGKEAVLMMLRYGIENLNIKKYEAKIGMSNNISITLFSKIGFVKDGESSVFKEITFTREVTNSWIEWLKTQTSFYSLTNRNLNV